MEQRDVSKIEHTMNIMAGIAVLKTSYSMHIDESDYLDIAVDILRDIKHFGTTEYIMYPTVRTDSKVLLPCNMDSIDAVTTEHMAKKSYSSRVLFEMVSTEESDVFYTMERTRNALLERNWRPGLGGFTGEGYISYQLTGKYIEVSKDLIGSKIGIAYTGISTDLDGFPLITRKQSNAIAAVCARVLCLRGANKGDKALAGMVEFYSNEAGRLVQAASIPEAISDNELDEVLNAKVTFNKKSYRRPTKYSR